MENDRRLANRRSSDERIAILEDRYLTLGERVDALEKVLIDIKGSVDNVGTKIESLEKRVAPLDELVAEARSTYRFLRKVVLYLLLPFAGIYLLVSGIPAAENAFSLLLRLAKLLGGPAGGM